MTTLYVETSTVLCWLLGESRAAQVAGVLDDAKRVVTSTLTQLEGERCLLRHHLVGRTSEAAYRHALGVFRDASADWQTLEITRGVRKRAAERFPVEPVRSLDAIHLASALAFAEMFGAVAVLSFDQRIQDNLEPLGLHTLPV